MIYYKCIANETYIKKEIKIFNNYYECEMACRFLRFNNKKINILKISFYITIY